MAEEHRTSVTDDAGLHRYEISVDGTVAGFATYRDRPGARIVLHSEVLPEFEHHGLASELARAALDDIRRRGLKVVPRCPFFARYIAEHDDYADLVAT